MQRAYETLSNLKERTIYDERNPVSDTDAPANPNSAREARSAASATQLSEEQATQVAQGNEGKGGEAEVVNGPSAVNHNLGGLMNIFSERDFENAKAKVMAQLEEAAVEAMNEGELLCMLETKLPQYARFAHRICSSTCGRGSAEIATSCTVVLLNHRHGLQ